MLHWIEEIILKFECYYGTFLANELSRLEYTLIKIMSKNKSSLGFSSSQLSLSYSEPLLRAPATTGEFKSCLHCPQVGVIWNLHPALASFSEIATKANWFDLFCCICGFTVFLQDEANCPSPPGSQSESFYDFIPCIISIHWAFRQLVKLHNF